MNRNLVIGLVAAAIIVIGGGVGYYLLTNSDDETTTNQQSTEGTSSTATETAPEFNPAPTENQSFEATLEGTAGESEINATILYDGEGNAKYSGESAGQTFEAYLADGAYIACSAGQCIKVSGASQQVINVDQFSYSAEDYNQFKSSANYKGKQDCPAGSCDTWEYTREGYTTTIFVDDQGRVNQLRTTGADGSFTYIFDYKDVTIVLPTNIRELPALNTPTTE